MRGRLPRYLITFLAGGVAFAIAIARTPNTARPAIAPGRRLGRDEAG